MKTTRLIREVNEPSGRGPGNGMYALQLALREAGVDWLKIGGQLQADEIPLIWCWLDKPLAVRCEIERRPYILGANVLFENSRKPGASFGERLLCNGRHSLGIITESVWYADLIRSELGKQNAAKVSVVPYPIYPTPEGTLPAKHDMLIYAKSGYTESLVVSLQAAWPRSVVIRYGHYKRPELIDAARQSRCCIYLSDDDRGPLALAEIMLCGCPAVGVERGAPWIINGQTGYRVESLGGDVCQAIVDAAKLDREAVRQSVMPVFDPNAAAADYVEIITTYLRA